MYVTTLHVVVEHSLWPRKLTGGAHQPYFMSAKFQNYRYYYLKIIYEELLKNENQKFREMAKIYVG